MGMVVGEGGLITEILWYNHKRKIHVIILSMKNIYKITELQHEVTTL